MEDEVAPLRARLVGAASGGRRGRARDAGRGSAASARGAGRHGRRRAQRAARRWPRCSRRCPCSRVIVVGVAGGLSADARRGGALVAERVVDEADGSVLRGGRRARRSWPRGRAEPRRGVAVDRAFASPTRRTRSAGSSRSPTRGSPTPATALRSAVPRRRRSRVGGRSRPRRGARGHPVAVLARRERHRPTSPLPALLNRSRDDGGAVRRGPRRARAPRRARRRCRRLLALRDARARLRERPRARRRAHVEALCAAGRSRRRSRPASCPTREHGAHERTPEWNLDASPLADGAGTSRRAAAAAAEDQPHVRADDSDAAGAAPDRGGDGVSAVSHHRHLRGRDALGAGAPRERRWRQFVRLMEDARSTRRAWRPPRAGARSAARSRRLPRAPRARRRGCSGGTASCGAAAREQIRRHVDRAARNGMADFVARTDADGRPAAARRCRICATTASPSPASSARC